MAQRWIWDGIRRGIDRLSGATIWQLTTAPVITHDIYGEQIYASTDGKRIAFLREILLSGDGSPDPSEGRELWVYELLTKRAAYVSDAVGPFATTPLTDALYYVRLCSDDDASKPKYCLTRLNLKTMERDDVFTFSDCPLPISATVSSDERFFVGAFRIKGNLYGLYRIDLVRGAWEVFHEKEDILNPHLQFEPSEGRDILVQWNRGGVVDEAGNIVRLVGEEGATLYVIDIDGKNFRPLPVGKPFTAPITGHECWVGATKQVLLTAGDGTIYLVKVGDEKAKVVAKNKGFNHISASADGQFFVVDDFRNGVLYVGSLVTGRCLPLCDSHASCGRPQYTHTHPYITPDNRYVIFNSDQTGICQIYAAEIPDGFLDDLTAS